MISRNRANSTILDCYYNSRTLTYLILHDKFGYGQKRIVKLEQTVDKYLDDYQDGVYAPGYFENEMRKRGLDVHEIVGSIPSRVKLFLTWGGEQRGSGVQLRDMRAINASLVTFLSIEMYALNKDMKISCVKLKDEYVKWFKFNVECLAEKGRLSMYDVVYALAKECKYLDNRYAIA